MVILDTHALVWLIYGHKELGRLSRKICEQALIDDNLHVSAITYWEIAMLVNNNKIDFIADVTNWRASLASYGVKEIPITGDIGIMANNLDNFHKDPADRIIAATAIINNAQLITADSLILKWKGKLKKHNALK